MVALEECRLPVRSSSGELIGHIKLTASSDPKSTESAPIIEMEESEAREHGESTIQLMESERYEYEVEAANGRDLRLRSSLSKRRRNLGLVGFPDAGLIETRSYCGTLLLELVEGTVNDNIQASGAVLIDVRSVKVQYRTEYRGMLRRMSDEMAALVVDMRASAKVGFRSTFEDRKDAGWLQIQMELLREVLDSADFAASMQRILSFPHECLSTFIEAVSTDRPIRWTPSAIRQLAIRNPRRGLLEGHPLRTTSGLQSVAEKVLLPLKSRDLDTPENRFIKYALGEFRSFLSVAYEVFNSKKGWGASASLAKRLAASVEDWLGRAMFREVGDMRFAPLGSPVLHRKAGYREVLRWWLRFRTAAELSWEGGEDVFRAGQRDVASLYEYWLFFELLTWFCDKCRGGARPKIEELVDGLDNGSPSLSLKKQIELGPFEGVIEGSNRRLSAKFSYNRRFESSEMREAGGSWTRNMHPDYTLTFWPSELDEKYAEENELLVHIHFDAKYRVESIAGLFGDSKDDGSDPEEESDGNYKRQDLLKMHAYRDAIKRSQGAYILYPGRNNAATRFSGFHELLPGLGAFGVAPNEDGKAQGMDSLSAFLDEAVAHLTNRATAQERLSYHLRSAYRGKVETKSVAEMTWKETDHIAPDARALPPSEHWVLVSAPVSQATFDWTVAHAIFAFDLGDDSTGIDVPPRLSAIRHCMVGVDGEATPHAMLCLTKLGFRLLSGEKLSNELHPSAIGSHTYAVFAVEVDVDLIGLKSLSAAPMSSKFITLSELLILSSAH